MVIREVGAVHTLVDAGTQPIGSASLALSDEQRGDDDDIMSRLNLIRSICEVGF
jgi:hypothetical protein